MRLVSVKNYQINKFRRAKKHAFCLSKNNFVYFNIQNFKLENFSDILISKKQAIHIYDIIVYLKTKNKNK